MGTLLVGLLVGILCKGDDGLLDLGLGWSRMRGHRDLGSEERRLEVLCTMRYPSWIATTDVVW